MKLHIYNPEHDICLADGNSAGTSRASLPACQAVRAAYGHLPAYWADDGDKIVVDDPATAAERCERERRRHADVEFITLDDVRKFDEDSLPTEILPWGWDRQLVSTLIAVNPLLSPLLPDMEQLQTIRRLSSRTFTALNLLPRIISLYLNRAPNAGSEVRLTPAENTASVSCIGEMVALTHADDVCREMSRLGRAVLKSPWSCSGRGVRMIDRPLTPNDRGWINNILRRQGAVMLEPLYDSLLDFGMEFFVGKDFTVRYLGMSVFDTRRGAYLGNVIDSEANKLQTVCQYLPESLLVDVRESIVRISTQLFHGHYHGPFGIDMMVVKTHRGICLHPCVELNLRRTMGHAALAMFGRDGCQ